jgi:hypothetical protein
VTIEIHEDAAMPENKKAKQAKIAKVMREFKSGTLMGSDKKPITNRKQAIAVALSSAGMSMAGKSDAYWDSYVMTMMQGEGEEEEETMDETAGEARCKGYLRTLEKDRAKKR